MTSILTNNAAMSALSVLREIDRDLGETQDRVSSGLRVQTAADNAAYWSIAATLTTDKAALDTVGDSLGLSQVKVDTAFNGLNMTKDVLGQIRNKLISAQDAGADKVKINNEITQLKAQLLTIAQGSTFSSENWLYNPTANTLGNRQMVGAFNRGPDNAISVQMIDFDASKSVLIDRAGTGGILTKNTTVNTGQNASANYYLVDTAMVGGVTGTVPTGTKIEMTAATTNTVLSQMQQAVDMMITSVLDVATTLGAIKNRVDTQTTFVKDVSATMQKGISRLVDADMNEESTKLKALQTRQQLAIQALSIANTQAQNIMQLFR